MRYLPHVPSRVMYDGNQHRIKQHSRVDILGIGSLYVLVIIDALGIESKGIQEKKHVSSGHEKNEVNSRVN